eukprot:TRINITY_DN11831_c0_g1_i1.p1 TRINITY_DN11831_c0_g1~~TRINITY_DN11831_c0_g1_i1.p1  ORF type:complete len:781 (+),score=200.34 TRINITY_DN11831_c0_g1_i1:192-2534(+)
MFGAAASSVGLLSSPPPIRSSPSSSSPAASFQVRYYDTNRSVSSSASDPSSSSLSVYPPYPNSTATSSSTVSTSKSNTSNSFATPSSSYSSASSLSLTTTAEHENKHASHTKQLQNQLDDLQRMIEEKSSTMRHHLAEHQVQQPRSTYKPQTPAPATNYTPSAQPKTVDRNHGVASIITPSPAHRITPTVDLHRTSLPQHTENGHDRNYHAHDVPRYSAQPSYDRKERSNATVERRHPDQSAIVNLTNELESLRSRRREKEHYLYSELARVSRRLRENVAESKARYEIAMLREKRKETESLFERELQQLSLMWALDRQRQKANQELQMHAAAYRYYLESPPVITPDGYNSPYDGYYSSDVGGYYSGDESASHYEQRRKAFEEKQETTTKPTADQTAELQELKKKLKQALADIREKEAQIESLREELSALSSQESVDKLKQAMKEQEKAFQAEREEWETEKENLRLNYRKQIEKETKRLQEHAKQEQEVLVQKLATETLLRESAEQDIKTERLEKEGVQQLLQEARTVSERAQKDERNKNLDLQKGIQEQTKKNSELQSEIEKLREETRSLQQQLSEARNDLLELSKTSASTSLPTLSSQELPHLRRDSSEMDKRASVSVPTSSTSSQFTVLSPPPPLSPMLPVISPRQSPSSKSSDNLNDSTEQIVGSTEPIIYSPTKDDELDALISASIQKNLPNADDLPHNFMRVSKGLYLFGTKRLTILLRNGKPMVKTAGGSLIEFSDFAKKNGKAENAKIHKRHAAPDKDCVICIKRKVTSSKST